MRVAFHTIGCKLNQYETEAIREQFEARGYTVVDFREPADVYVVNSCTVTKKADGDARRLLRNAKRRSPSALVVATGCYAQTDADALAAMPEVDLVLGNQEKGRAADLVAAGRDAGAVHVGDILECHAFGAADVQSFAEHTRAFLKIQDGCDSCCAYCKVPLARGPNRSRPFADALAQVRRLCDAGHREIVLIGVHLGTYGRDLDPPRSLPELLTAILAEDRPDRLRLSSVEPLEFTDGLTDVLARHAGRLCRHLHIPLQSGCDRTLARMNRRYTAAQYSDLVHRLADRIPGIAIGADVLVGFPGEADDDFTETLRLCETLPLAYLHVFSYSVREGTAAATMPGHVRPDIVKTRCRALIELSKRRRESFLGTLVGTTQRVLLEQAQDDVVEGLTDTYARVYLPVGSARPNTLVSARITGVEGEVCRGAIE